MNAEPVCIRGRKIMDFVEFGLDERLLKGIEAAGYVSCTPVQEQVIQASKTEGAKGPDLYVQSQTGTGKTCAYLVPVIEGMLKAENAGKKCLILAPTRELAVQIEEEAKVLVGTSGLKAFSVYGGVGYEKQIAALKKGVDIIIGTPGRVIDLNEGGNLDLSNAHFCVIDEADRMFDMGFYDDLRKILKCLPEAETRQTMLFSATLNTYVKNLAWEYTRDPIEITIEAENITVSEISQELLHVSSDEKMKLLVGILKHENPDSAIIFCNTKRSCEVIAKRLVINEIGAEFMIGDLPQSKRLAIMKSFKAGNVQILVATDVAARGIDVSGIEAVINYDIPNEFELYVHRIGRTARAGSYGVAITFTGSHSRRQIADLEKYIHHNIQVLDVPTVEDIKAKRQKNLYLKINEKMESLEDVHKYDSLIMKLSKQNKDPMPLINALLEMINSNDRVYNDIQNVVFKNKESGKKNSNKKDSKKEKAKGFSDSKEKSIISVNVGKKDNVRPNQLVVYFHDELKIHREHFGKIVIKDNESFIEINSDALRFFKDLHKHRFNGRRIDYKKVDKMPK